MAKSDLYPFSITWGLLGEWQEVPCGCSMISCQKMGRDIRMAGGLCFLVSWTGDEDNRRGTMTQVRKPGAQRRQLGTQGHTARQGLEPGLSLLGADKPGEEAGLEGTSMVS